MQGANKRGLQRRAALRALNALVVEQELPLPHIDAKKPRAADLAKVLRALSRRCVDDDALAFKAAVLRYVRNSGVLPDGFSVADDGDLTADTADTETPAVPKHRFLKFSFRLQSTAFMLTYNSSDFSAATWVAFKTFVEDRARRYGARAWAACLEVSLHADAAHPGQRLHTHACMLWTDGIGLRLRSLEPLYFEDTRPRVDVCVTRGSPVGAGA